LQMVWRRLPVFRSDIESRSAVVSLIVADRSHRTGLRSVADVTFTHAEKQMSRDADIEFAAVLAMSAASLVSQRRLSCRRSHEDKEPKDANRCR
jgi:hypothetical protein